MNLVLLAASASVLGFLGLGAPDVDASRWSDSSVSMRLVVDEPEGGKVKAALVVDLQPGWKTYWSAPGEAGVAPVFDFGGSQDVAVEDVVMPPPVRFGEGEATVAGYVASTAVAVEGRVAPGAMRPEVRLSVTFGVCREVCVPLHAELAAPVPDTIGPEDAIVIDRTFAALAEDVATGFGVEASADGSYVVSAPAGVEEVFVDAPGAAFGASTPEVVADGMKVFRVPRLTGSSPSVVRQVVGRSAGRAWRQTQVPVATPAN